MRAHHYHAHMVNNGILAWEQGDETTIAKSGRLSRQDSEDELQDDIYPNTIITHCELC